MANGTPPPFAKRRTVHWRCVPRRAITGTRTVDPACVSRNVDFFLPKPFQTTLFPSETNTAILPPALARAMRIPSLSFITSASRAESSPTVPGRRHPESRWSLQAGDPSAAGTVGNGPRQNRNLHTSASGEVHDSF